MAKSARSSNDAAEPREKSGSRKRSRPKDSDTRASSHQALQGVGAELLGDQAPELQTGASRKRSRKSPVISEHPSQHRKDVVSLVQHAADLEIAKTTAHEAQLQLRSQQAEEISALQHEHQQAIKRLEQGNRELSTQLQIQTTNSKQLKYAVRGSSDPRLQGSVPLTIFSAEPNSLLATMYNSTWEYERDEDGRAIVNSDPAHWALILNWLSFGAVPQKPSPDFEAECRYWQLENLLEALKPVIPEPDPEPVEDPLDDCLRFHKNGQYDFHVHFDTKDGRGRFRAEGYVDHFRDCMGHVTSREREAHIILEAFGRPWYIHISACIIHIYPGKVNVDRPDDDPDHFTVKATLGKVQPCTIVNSARTCAMDLAENGSGMDYITEAEMGSPPYVDGRGRAFLTITVTYVP